MGSTTRHLTILGSLLAAFLIVSFGCGTESPTAFSPAATFNDEHGGTTHTPHGIIVPDSARDTPEGEIEYATSDGSVWTTAPSSDTGYTMPEKAN